MMNYFYYQLLLIIKFLLFCSKTQRIRNDKISKYDSNPLENIDLENSIQNQEKNEIEPIHKRQLQEDDQGLPIDIYVDWSAIKNVFGSRGENKANLNINVIDSAINEVKETLKLINQCKKQN